MVLGGIQAPKWGEEGGGEKRENVSKASTESPSSQALSSIKILLTYYRFSSITDAHYLVIARTSSNVPIKLPNKWKNSNNKRKHALLKMKLPLMTTIFVMDWPSLATMNCPPCKIDATRFAL
jgi:hypothetical protein